MDEVKHTSLELAWTILHEEWTDQVVSVGFTFGLGLSVKLDGHDKICG